jgi:hypothetical protein
MSDIQCDPVGDAGGLEPQEVARRLDAVIQAAKEFLGLLLLDPQCTQRLIQGMASLFEANGLLR